MKITLTIASSFLLVLFAVAEVLLAIPVAWWLYLSAVLLFTTGFLARRPIQLQTRRIGVVVGVALGVAVLYFVPWSSRKPFLHDLYSIRRGMTEADVRRIMGKYMEGTGWPAVYGSETPGEGTLATSDATYATTVSPKGELAIRNSLVFRHSNSGQFNADFGIVEFKNGKVTQVSFSPD